MTSRFSWVFGVAVMASATTACRGQTSRESPIYGIRNMFDQQRYDIQSESDFFADKRTMRPLPEGAISHTEETDSRIAQGRLNDQSGYVLTVPVEVIERAGGMASMLKRGQERYGIYCSPCHDNTGNGNGVVKQRAIAAGAAAFQPPSFHDDKYRHMPDGQLYATIANGKGNMPPYAQAIPVQDRWSIVSYVRALQLSNPSMPGVDKPMSKTEPAPVVAVHHVEVKGDHILIDQKIQFVVGKDEISSESFPLLDEMSETFKANPQIHKVEVQGYSSSEGDKAKNTALSTARAKAVVAALVTRGSTKEMFVAKGFGPEKPIADNTTDEGREKNRRVEFLITDPAPRNPSIAPSTVTPHGGAPH
jgi:outer membrane protein OmpA-like peptidoglycan-associated protein